MKEIILSDGVSHNAITEEVVEKCCSELLEKVKELGYNEDACYQIAAVNLWLWTQNFSEREEILNMLHLK